MKEPNQNFKEQALSFIGCDGGNLEAPLWFCGLEWGLKGTGQQIDTNESENPEDYQTPTAWRKWQKEDKNKEYFGNVPALDQKIAWFYYMYYQKTDSKGYGIDNRKDDYFKLLEQEKIGHLDGPIFKLNMYPVCFSSRQVVAQNIDKLNRFTGLNGFDEYRELVVELRGEYFRKLVDQYNPKLIICLGLLEKDRFIRFFTNQKKSREFCEEDLKVYYTKMANGATVCVVPFFGGRHGINSFAKMKALTECIKQIEKL